MTFRLGLTGGIGTGKSSTAALFAEAGVPVWDADAAVHRLYARGGLVAGILADVMPWAMEDGAVSRDKLKARMVYDPTVLPKLERYVHPVVAADRAIFAETATAPVTLFDVPLLYETGADKWMDAVVVVTCPKDIQRERVLARGDMTAKELDTILARQMPDADKRARADHVIETLTLDAARADVARVLSEIRGKLPDA